MTFSARSLLPLTLSSFLDGSTAFVLLQIMIISKEGSNTMEHVVAASNKSRNNNKVVKNDLSKALPPTNETNIFVGLMVSVAIPKRRSSTLLVSRIYAFS